MSTVLEVWEPAGFAVGVASAKKVVGELAAFANDWEGASADLESARSTFGSLGAASMVDELTVALALAAALGRRPTVALDLLSPRPERDQPPHIQARAYRAAGLAHAQLGDVSRAAASLHEAADVSPGFEQAVTFDAWVQLQDILGAPPQGWRRIVTDVFTHLGVEATPRAPR
jgi:hypothetical protein